MPKKTIVVEQFHITVIAPIDLPKTEDTAIPRTLRSKRFQARLRDAVRNLFRSYPTLRKAMFRIER